MLSKKQNRTKYPRYTPFRRNRVVNYTRTGNKIKKSNGEYRFCFDGRALNETTRHDSYPLPHIDRILNNLRNAKFISSIDLRKAFWQIPLDSSSKEKTALSIIGKGQFQFTVMPFGLCNSAQTQQRLVDSLFGPKYELLLTISEPEIRVKCASTHFNRFFLIIAYEIRRN